MFEKVIIKLTSENKGDEITCMTHYPGFNKLLGYTFKPRGR